MKTAIVIAASGRTAMLARVLETLAPQLDRDRHLLAIAENATPEPVALSPVLAAMLSFRIHFKEPGKTRAQNAAIRRAIEQWRPDVFAFLDDDVVVAPDYLLELESFFREHREFAAMKGRILPETDPVATLGRVAVYLDLPLVDHGESPCEVRGVVGANMAFRTEVFSRVGAFDERLGPGASGYDEEAEISERIRRAGMRIGYAPRVIVYHAVEPGRASRERFLASARAHGFSRGLHAPYSVARARLNHSLAKLRCLVARAMRVRMERMAREERRLAIASGMLEGLKQRTAQAHGRGGTVSSAPSNPD